MCEPRAALLLHIYLDDDHDLCFAKFEWPNESSRVVFGVKLDEMKASSLADLGEEIDWCFASPNREPKCWNDYRAQVDICMKLQKTKKCGNCALSKRMSFTRTA
jgi:hypothetical protein